MIKLSPAANGDRIYALRLSYQARSSALLLTFGRSADVGWSPSGRNFFVSDHIGSDVSECFAFSVGGASLRRQSLSRAVARSVGRPRAPEAPGSAHYYVDCDRWVSDDLLSADVSGHVDGPVHEFDHPFIYSVRSGRIWWRRGSVSHERR